MSTITVPDDVAELAMDVAGHDGSSWFHQCHAASIQIVESGLFPGARVARGDADGVGGQHSWVVLNSDVGPAYADCYDHDARILDATLWSYDGDVKGIWRGRNINRHVPKGFGGYMSGNLPTMADHGDRTMVWEGAEKLGYQARGFLLDLGFITYGDRRAASTAVGWMKLANLPVFGWPAEEILDTMADDPRLAAFIPVDVLGMLTLRNPGGLYLQGEEKK